MELSGARIVKGARIKVVAATVVVVFAVGILASGGTVQVWWLRAYSAGVLVATVLLAAWDRYLWKLPFVQRIPQVARNLSGTWKGTLESFWIDPSTGQRPPIKPVYLVVRQTASAISVVLLTDESRSKSTLAAISIGGAPVSLDYLYLNRPDAEFEDRSRMHHGSTVLDVSGLPATRLRGRYWTDRDTKGQLDFVERLADLADDFEQAVRVFKSQGNAR
jgi:hypothetical protein